jgi:YD repeat-containing protein
VTATDGRGLSATQAFDVAVRADTVAPRVRLTLSSASTQVGLAVTVEVTASDNLAVTAIQLTVGGEPVALDGNGRATIARSTVGVFDVVAAARDAAANVGTATTTLLVSDPSATGAPEVSLTSPFDGAEITAPTDVRGTANDDTLLLWTLSVAPAGSRSFSEIARGTTPVIDGVLGRFDPSLLTNDSYALRLTATDGVNTATAERTVNVSGNLKLGNFTLSFTDMAVPVAGIPIQVTRTYDTLHSNQSGDVGFGWRLEFRDVRLRTSLPPTGLEADGYFNPFREGTKVYVTLPGGRREGFTFRPIEQPFFGQRIYRPNFVPDSGATSTLSVSGQEGNTGTFGFFRDFLGDRGVVTLQRRGDEYFSRSFGTLGLPYNPADALNFEGKYFLTTRDGTQYQIDAPSGKLDSVTDRNDNTLSFSDGGIVSSTGAAVTFARDARGRIVGITDPMGHEVRYEYDARGDLVAVTDRVQNTTQFAYRTVPAPLVLGGDRPRIWSHVAGNRVRGVGAVRWIRGGVRCQRLLRGGHERGPCGRLFRAGVAGSLRAL